MNKLSSSAITALAASTFAGMTLVAGSALGADLASRTIPLLASAPIAWTGFYVGLNAGGTFGDSSGARFSGAPFLIDPDAVAPGAYANAAASAASQPVAIGGSAGFIGGGQFGYNLQVSPRFVAGAEADIQGIAGGIGSGAQTAAVIPAGPNAGNPVISTEQVRKSLDYFGTVRARAGVLLAPNVLVYGTGGLAYGGLNSSASITQTIGSVNGANAGVGFGAASVSSTRVGWTGGGGAEWMFLQNWSAKIEYLYYDLGSVTYRVGTPQLNPAACATCTGFGPSSASVFAAVRSRGDLVRVGLNYHFN